MFIDPHVHLRDFNQSHKETILHGLIVARDSGVDAIFDMPNTDPPVLSKEIVKARIKLAQKANCPEVFYGLYMGLTANPEQIKQAVEIYRKLPQVVGFKLYAGHSVGALGLVSVKNQLTVYQTLTAEGYGGVLAVHCEKESEMLPSLWDPQNPESHNLARPPKAEVKSVRDQLMLVRKSGFSGKLHFVHLSVPESVELVSQAKEQDMDVSCAICPHHLIFNQKQLSDQGGIHWKMNPPLRQPSSRLTLLQHLHDGHIDWIETDHAPHTFAEKTEPPYMSGIPGLAWWPLFAAYLHQHGFTPAQIDNLTFKHAAKRFQLPIEKSSRQLKDHRKDYPFDPYAQIAEELHYLQ